MFMSVPSSFTASSSRSHTTPEYSCVSFSFWWRWHFSSTPHHFVGFGGAAAARYGEQHHKHCCYDDQPSPLHASITASLRSSPGDDWPVSPAGRRRCIAAVTAA